MISVVERVLNRHQCAPLTLENVQLNIRLLEPAASLPAWSEITDDTDSRLLLVRNIPGESVTASDLNQYFHHGLNLNFENISYSAGRAGIALLEFSASSLYGELFVSEVC